MLVIPTSCRLRPWKWRSNVADLCFRLCQHGVSCSLRFIHHMQGPVDPFGIELFLCLCAEGTVGCLEALQKLLLLRGRGLARLLCWCYGESSRAVPVLRGHTFLSVLNQCDVPNTRSNLRCHLLVSAHSQALSWPPSSTHFPSLRPPCCPCYSTSPRLNFPSRHS